MDSKGALLIYELLILPGIMGASLYNGMPNTEVWALRLDSHHKDEAFQ